MTSDQVFIAVVLGAVVVVVALAILLTYLAGGLVLAFTGFVAMLLESSPILAILLFILFPPTLIVFLVGITMIKLGLLKRYIGKPVSDEEAERLRSKEAGSVVDEKTRATVVKQRRMLGYDD